MPPRSAGRLDGAISEVLLWRFTAYWKQQGQSTDRRECRVRWQERVYKYVGIQPEALQTTVELHFAQ